MRKLLILTISCALLGAGTLIGCSLNRTDTREVRIVEKVAAPVCPTVDLEKFYQTRIIAETIAQEACGEGAKGMLAVANTIANRAAFENKSPYQIVIAPSQYSGYTAPTRALRYSECKVDADMLAENILNLEDITDGATYFKTKKEKRKKWHKILTVKIGKHEFYKEERTQ